MRSKYLVFVAGLLAGLVISSTRTSNLKLETGQDMHANTRSLGGLSSSASTSTASDIPTIPPTRPTMNWTAYYQDHPSLTISKMGAKHQTGLGSQILNLIAEKIYVNDMGRSFAVDTAHYYMQYNPQVGVLGGWFYPTFPLIQNVQDQQELARIFPQYSNALANSDVGMRVQTKRHEMWQAIEKGDEEQARILLREASRESAPALDQGIKKIDQNDPELHVLANPALTWRKDKFLKNYPRQGTQIFQRFATETCSNFPFHNHALQQFVKVKAAHNIPEFRSDNTVAFHVRRGDKLAHESPSYPGSDYVLKFLQVLPNDASPIEHCFVATDDHKAVGEIQQALTKNGVPCTLHTLTLESEHGHQTDGNNQFDDIVQFLTELSVLVDATYFVGTFNSNVGSLATLMRSCVHIGAPHWHHSYGVDREDWFFV